MTTQLGRLFIVSAPSGGGKTSLTRALLPRLAGRNHAAAISVSYTTRAPRAGEIDGEHYHFVDDARFLQMVAAGEFLEHAEVFGRRYGTGRRRSAEVLEQGTDLILDIDWQGAQQVRAALPETHSVFILPPSVGELERRLSGRGQDDATTIAGRMAAARAEISHWDEYDSLIVNDDFERALEDLGALFIAPLLSRDEQTRRQAGLIRDLLD